MSSLIEFLGKEKGKIQVRLLNSTVDADYGAGYLEAMENVWQFIYNHKGDDILGVNLTIHPTADE